MQPLRLLGTVAPGPVTSLAWRLFWIWVHPSRCISVMPTCIAGRAVANSRTVTAASPSTSGAPVLRF